MTMNTQIRSLHTYPIKSCAGIDLTSSAIDRAGLAYDRRWMLVAADGQFMTQRQWPRMALIRPSLSVHALCLNAPGMSPFDVPLDGSQLIRQGHSVSVWHDVVAAQPESEACARWFSTFLGVECRLFKFDSQARRFSHERYVDDWLASHGDLAAGFDGKHPFGFADGFPLLVANQASLDDLNSRLLARSEPAVTMDRFRPNIVIEGEWQAFDEDHTALVSSGAVRMALVKPCARCSVPDIDQVTAQHFSEPGRTLAAYRRFEIGVVFGQNAVVDVSEPACLWVGDAVTFELDF